MNVVIGFIFLLLLGFAASRLTLFQGRLSLGTQYLFLAGTEFLLVGLVLGPQVTNVLTAESLRQLSPIVSLGLGWIGFLIGMQFERSILARISIKIWGMGLVISGVTFFLCFGMSYVTLPWMMQWQGMRFHWGETVMIAQSRMSICFVLACIASVSTYSALALIKRNADARGDEINLLQLLTDVRSPIAIVTLGLWHCLNHRTNMQVFSSLESPSKPVLPGSNLLPASLPESVQNSPVLGSGEWIVLTILLGLAFGWVLHYLTNHRLRANEMLLVLTGSIILTGGVSAYLHLSPLFVNMIMGATLANLPNFAKSRITSWLTATEKPFFVIFMILVGAMWPPITPLVLVMTTVYCISRMIGLGCGTCGALYLFLPKGTRIPYPLGFAMLPQGGVTLAMAIDFALIRSDFMAETVLGIIILATLLQQVLGPKLLVSVLQSLGNIKSPEKDTIHPPRMVKEPMH